MVSVKLVVGLLASLTFIIESECRKMENQRRPYHPSQTNFGNLQENSISEAEKWLNGLNSSPLLSEALGAMTQADVPGRRERGREGNKEYKKKGRGRGKKRMRRRQAKMEMMMARLSESMNEFSWKLYQTQARDQPDNFVFSPLSVYTAMSMVMLGASGRTKRELVKGLSANPAVHVGMAAYNDTLDLGEDSNTALNMANAVYSKPGFTWNTKFMRKLAKWYGSEMQEFEAENPEEAINDWVEDQTNGEIVDFLSEGTITPMTAMMLINAIYFKGSWKEKFDPERTTSAVFKVSPTEQHKVDMMFKNEQFKTHFSHRLNAQILELPYEGDRFSLFILLPNPDSDLASLEAALDAQILNETLSSVEHGFRRDVYLPKFSLDASQEMKPFLQKLGITSLFSGKCRLKKMTRSRDLYVSSVQHQAIIEVDEEGTTAAAATGIQVMLTSLPPTFRADRPFMFVLRDTERNVNLFMGRYVNPKGQNIAM